MRGGVLMANVLAGALLFLVAVDGYNCNVATRHGGQRWALPRYLRVVIGGTQLIQDWRLFAPDPYRESGTWVAAAVTVDGRQIDLLSLGDKTSAIRDSRFWRKYLTRLRDDRFEPLRPYLARYLIRKYGAPVVRLSLLYNRRPTPPPGTALFISKAAFRP
jgi:hypothetical protein